jgi:protein SCO1/2
MTALVAIRVMAGSGGAPAGSPTPPPLSTYLYPGTGTAPPLALADQDGTAFDAADLAGGPTLVFFGYTHCPDVCPATIGIVSEVIAGYGTALRAVFVTVDPERDTVAWLHDYVRYLPAGFRALTGSPAEVRATADAWGVRYARVETGTPGAYSMSHTAEVYLVDGTGRLRAHFPFGTGAPEMLEVVRAVAGSGAPAVTATPATPSPAGPTPAASPDGPATGPLSVEVVSTSVWAGGGSPVILRLFGPDGRISDPAAEVTVALHPPDGSGPATQTVRAVAVRPPMVAEVSYVATLDVPSPGWWRLDIEVSAGGSRFAGSISVPVLHPGRTAQLGAPAPSVQTPTLADVGGVAMAVTTDPLPDPRLYSLSTVDALAAHRPFVMVVDSARFKVTDACGTALAMVKYLPDRWEAQVTFIHLEPFIYDVITESPVLRGSLGSPPLNAAAAAWGFEGDPWGATTMPWVFVVDGDGVVKAKYQGVIGSEDVDTILSMVTAGD